MPDLTTAERAALDAWSSVSADTNGMLFAVRAAVRDVERRHDQSDDHRIASLTEALAAIRDLAYRTDGVDAPAAIEVILQRASRALNEVPQ
ncbi:hypothetical protein AB0F72_08600 [Actinoplanes sp. NPDC023936]|uniref:hypothetical protein n=1 Tax=Actinoplanes sp. NPDC023936 TaxID=3154910 RepID=UPI0033CAD76D